MSEQTLMELSERLTRQDERMNTHQAKYESALDRLSADLAKRDSDRDADMAKLGSAIEKLYSDMAKRDADRDASLAKRDADMAERDKANTQWMIGLWLATVVVLGVLVRLPF